MNSALSSMRRMFDDLRRRKVFRAAAAYGVTAWVMVAVADVVVPVLQMPDWTMNLVVLVAVTGLPIAVVLSWLFDLSAEGIVRTPAETAADDSDSERKSVAVYIAVLLVATAIGFLIWRPDGVPDDGDLSSIAVLPFADFSEEADAGYLGDGIAEELLNALVGVEGLRVAARTSSFAFKGLNEDVRSIGEKLNVDAVLEGSVRRADGRVRITAQLINVSDGFHLWSKTYDRELNDIFEIQVRIAEAIVDALKVQLGADDQQRMTRHAGTTFAAYDLYLLGRHHWHLRTPASLQRAIELFEEAIEVDPDFALAYSGLADAYLLQRDYAEVDREAAQNRAEAAIARALQLDDQLAEPYASLGLLRMSRNEMTGAELAFRSAIDLDGSYSMAHMWLGLVLDHTQGPAAAFEEYRAAYRSDPLHPVINGNLAGALGRMGRFSEALQYLRRSEEANPDAGLLRMHLAWLHAYYGQIDQSVDWALRADNQIKTAKPRRMLASNFATLGDIDRARSYLNTGDPVTEPVHEFEARAVVMFAAGEYARLLGLARERLALLEDKAGEEDGAGLVELGWAGVTQLAQADFAGAIEDLEAFLDSSPVIEAPRHVTFLGLLAHAYGQTGNFRRRAELIEESLAVYERERARGWASPEFHAAIAGTYALQGDRVRALAELNAARDEGWREHFWLLADPRFGALRGDPEFQATVAVLRSELDTMLARATELVDKQVAARLD